MHLLIHIDTKKDILHESSASESRICRRGRNKSYLVMVPRDKANAGLWAILTCVGDITKDPTSYIDLQRSSFECLLTIRDITLTRNQPVTLLCLDGCQLADLKNLLKQGLALQLWRVWDVRKWWVPPRCHGAYLKKATLLRIPPCHKLVVSVSCQWKCQGWFLVLTTAGTEEG